MQTVSNKTERATRVARMTVNLPREVADAIRAEQQRAARVSGYTPSESQIAAAAIARGLHLAAA
ncbi:hypothetical protein QO239_03735 [Cupriavidus taiwanensis]|uniref:hypothetical protein n=1 Tax=Cupriavidus taiwanensis TaxID=164546 RepID=UPI002540EC95|nr:hypothetical protein [Cupriavidus taiwanensis]MDK3021717.1 hypothetical protein [Cupriavidus taiwanensis]